MRRLTRSTQTAVTLLGSTLVTAGSVLPWLRVDPAHDGPVIGIWLPGMDSGLDLWGLVLVPAVLVLGVLHGFSSRPTSDLATLAIGGLSVGLVFHYRQFVAGGYFVPDVGWYVSLVGSTLLFVVGAQRVWTHYGDRGRPTDRRPA